MKTNIDIGDDAAGKTHHPDFADAYKIGDETYSLYAVVQAAAGERTPSAWNGLTEDFRVKTINEYLKSVDAEPTGHEAGSAGDEVEELKASNARMADVIETVRTRLGAVSGDDVTSVVTAVDQLIERANKPASGGGDKLATLERQAGLPTGSGPDEARLKRIEQMLGIR